MLAVGPARSSEEISRLLRLRCGWICQVACTLSWVALRPDRPSSGLTVTLPGPLAPSAPTRPSSTGSPQKLRPRSTPLRLRCLGRSETVRDGSHCDFRRGRPGIPLRACGSWRRRGPRGPGGGHHEKAAWVHGCPSGRCALCGGGAARRACLDGGRGGPFLSGPGCCRAAHRRRARATAGGVSSLPHCRFWGPGCSTVLPFGGARAGDPFCLRPGHAKSVSRAVRALATGLDLGPATRDSSGARCLLLGRRGPPPHLEPAFASQRTTRLVQSLGLPVQAEALFYQSRRGQSG